MAITHMHLSFYFCVFILSNIAGWYLFQTAIRHVLTFRHPLAQDTEVRSVLRAVPPDCSHRIQRTYDSVGGLMDPISLAGDELCVTLTGGAVFARLRVAGPSVTVRSRSVVTRVLLTPAAHLSASQGPPHLTSTRLCGDLLRQVDVPSATVVPRLERPAHANHTVSPCAHFTMQDVTRQLYTGCTTVRKLAGRKTTSPCCKATWYKRRLQRNVKI